jgi:hypothetical protein
MNSQLVVQAEVLRQTAEQLARVGLVIDPACLSLEQRRAIFALKRIVNDAAPQPEPRRARIGFTYPNAR